MKALDLFCSSGGWSDGLVVEGFEVLGVEIEPEIVKLYNHPCLIADVRELRGKWFRDFDLIVGSPPCRDFTHFSKAVWKKGESYGYRRWKEPPNPEKGMELVNAFLRIVEEAEPTFWLMENVPELERHINIKPRMEKVVLAPHMRRSFWGEFPLFLIPQALSKKKYGQLMKETHFKEIKSVMPYRRLLASFIYARIPLPVARALGKAVRECLS